MTPTTNLPHPEYPSASKKKSLKNIKKPSNHWKKNKKKPPNY
jgi:hypothetical protein